MADVRMNIDEFKEKLEKIPGKANTQKIRTAINFYIDMLGDKELLVYEINPKTGKKKLKKTSYSPTLYEEYKKMNDRVRQDLGNNLEFFLEEEMND